MVRSSRDLCGEQRLPIVTSKRVGNPSLTQMSGYGILTTNKEENREEPVRHHECPRAILFAQYL